MEEKKLPAETAILIDAYFLEMLTTDFKKNFERIIGRELNTIDLSELLTYIALDGGITPGENDIDVLFIYNSEHPSFSNCIPARLDTELNNVAFKNSIGEFTCRTFPNERIVSTDDMFVDSLQIIAEAKEVKRLLVVGYNEEYGDKIEEVLDKTEGKIITQFRMDEPKEKKKYATEIIAYPVMKALGIKGEELN